ncbi:hypothetical protein QFC19_001620 [Naganishia cerealis]|uniref:Uncharacterized protein n=1 Tax=Naganishia cerealis TaxID=610337 RepID=A0ACC2WH22_9TREE|nr:hypothetical protein QFC19_001620 [Naganishia cerealis]
MTGLATIHHFPPESGNGRLPNSVEDQHQSDVDSSESDPSSGQEYSPDYSDTDSSSGEATITAGPSGKGNLIGRALLAAGRAENDPARSSGAVSAGIGESEGHVAEWQHSRGGAYVEPRIGSPASSSFSPLERTLSNPAGWANEVSRHIFGSSIPASQAEPMQQFNGSPGLLAARNGSRGSMISNPQRSQGHSGTSAPIAPPNAQPFSSASTFGTSKHRRYPETAADVSKPNQVNHLADRPGHSLRENGSGLSRPQYSLTTTLPLASQPTSGEKRSPSTIEGKVVRTASLPKMSRLQGFSPLVKLNTLSHQEPNAAYSTNKFGNEGNTSQNTDSDQEGIYMDVSESRRKRSLRRRRKAASDGSRTPISPALTITSSPASPALSLPSSVDSSPIHHILGHASIRGKSRLGDTKQEYSARNELRKRRGSQHNATQQSHQVLDATYLYHIPPRLIHQPRSDFSAASTSGESAYVSSGYTASAGSGDTRSDASQSSSSALGLSLGDEGLAIDGRIRRPTQFSRQFMNDEGTWDGNYTDTIHSPSPIFSAYETDVPAIALPPSATSFTQSSKFPLVIFLLRLLAVVPATLGAFSLMWNAILPASVTLGQVGHSAGDNLMSLPWAALTGMFCFELTTGLTHRWLLYYSLAPTLLRLVSLQSICWPSTFITLRYLGSIDILFAWIVVGTTTACSRSVQIWVTSNVPEYSTRSLKPAQAIVSKSEAMDTTARAFRDIAGQRTRDISDKSKRNNLQSAQMRIRERFWDWKEIIGAVWVRNRGRKRLDTVLMSAKHESATPRDAAASKQAAESLHDRGDDNEGQDEDVVDDDK